jgi:hypothetical protein
MNNQRTTQVTELSEAVEKAVQGVLQTESEPSIDGDLAELINNIDK